MKYYITVYAGHKRPRVAIGPFISHTSAFQFVERHKLTSGSRIVTGRPLLCRVIQPMPGINFRDTLRIEGVRF